MRLRPRRSLLLAAVGLALLAGVLAERVVALRRAAPTDFDDAYMYLRYAAHLLAGQGVTWNPGEGAVHGVTSPLHLAVVTVVRWGLPSLAPAGILQVASGVAAVGLLVLLACMAAWCCGEPRLRRAWLLGGAIVVAAVAYHDAFRFHAATGMDTMLSALTGAGVALASLRLSRVPSVSNASLAALAAVLAVLARPDNVVCATGCPVLALLLLAPAPRRRPLVVFCGAVLGLIAALTAVEWKLLGSPLPLAFFAKSPGYYGGFAGEYGWNPFLFLKVFLLSVAPFVVAVVLFAERGRGLRRSAVLLVPALVSILILFRFNQIMGHLGRFYYPFLPFFVAAGIVEFDSWLGRAQRLEPRRLVAAACGVVAVAVLLSAGAGAYERRAQQQKLAPLDGFHVVATSALPEIDSWEAAKSVAAMAAAAPPGTTWAMSEHGLPGALAPDARIIDVLGLHDPYFARHGFSARELFRRRPDVLWLPHEDHTQMLRGILDSDELWAHYAFYPDAFYHGLALRLDSPHARRLEALFAAEWRRLYPGTSPSDHRAIRGN